MKLRKWYFALNQSAVGVYGPLTKAAVISAQRNTELQANCLYDGEDNDLTEWLTANGVNLIRHRVSLYDAIAAEPDTDHWKKNIATGAYLRVDIPLMESEEDFILYTDADVIFLKHPSYEGEPHFFAVAPEHDPENWNYANTGSMVMNIASLRQEHPAFTEFASKQLNKFAPLGHGTYDQGALNAYFSGKWDRLPLNMNWKPYWGLNPDTEIVHFHGPKPQHIIRLMNGDANLPAVYKGLYKRNPEAFSYYLGQFQNNSPPRTVRGYLDRATQNGDQTSVRGWAVYEDGSPAEVTIQVEGHPVSVTGVKRFHREDIAGKIPAARDAGFEVSMPPVNLSELKVYAGKQEIKKASGFKVVE